MILKDKRIKLQTMELINLERILSQELINQIDVCASSFAGDEQYRIIYGQIYIGTDNIMDEEFAYIIVDIICSNYRITKAILMSDTRKQPYMKYRQIAVYFISKFTNMSYADIAGFFNNKNHSSVTHSLGVIDNYIATDPEYKEELEKLNDKLVNLIKEKHDNNIKRSPALHD